MQVMNVNEVDLINDSIRDSKIHFILDPLLWDCIDSDVKKIVKQKWTEIKYYTDKKVKNDELSSIPNDTGGIYVFVAKPDIIPDAHIYLMYIGRAKYTSSQNLRKRCLEYCNPNRVKIKRMMEQWWKYIYIRYLPIEGNDIIDKVEAELINKILPPCNEKIPNKTISDAVKAFSI